MNVSVEARASEAATTTRQVEMSAGTIDYIDTGGDGAPIRPRRPAS